MSEQDQFVLESESGEESVPITGEMRVGRDPSCDLVLASGKASRVHAKLGVEGDSLWVEDQGSTNGSFVNRERISKRVALGDGDIVQFGDVRYRVKAPAGPGEVEGTVMVGQKTMLHMLQEDKEVGESPVPEEKEQPAAEEKAEPTSERETSEAKTAGAEASEKPAKPGKKAKAKKAKKAKATPKPNGDAEKPKEERAAGKSSGAGRGEGSIEGRSGSDPSIPRSWADADQLEQASHTAFVARAPGDAGGSARLSPAQALTEARRSIPADQPILVGLTDPIRGKPFKLSHKGGTQKWEMGRGDRADVSIEDESVSGRHAQLICEEGRWKVVNMMSVNGTFVNDRKVLSAYLSPHDIIRMGTVELVFDARVKARRTPTPESRVKGAGKMDFGAMVESIKQSLQKLADSIQRLFRRK